jgi:aldehyde:ferredoxin oxidoreductase
MTVFRVVRVDLSTEKITEEVYKEDLVRKFLGGRGLAPSAVSPRWPPAGLPW